jgi:transposase
MRYELSDAEWAIIRPMLPDNPGGVPRVDDSRVLNGIFWVLRSGAPGRDLPSTFGPTLTWPDFSDHGSLAGVAGAVSRSAPCLWSLLQRGGARPGPRRSRR